MEIENGWILDRALLSARLQLRIKVFRRNDCLVFAASTLRQPTRYPKPIDPAAHVLCEGVCGVSKVKSEVILVEVSVISAGIAPALFRACRYRLGCRRDVCVPYIGFRVRKGAYIKLT